MPAFDGTRDNRWAAWTPTITAQTGAFTQTTAFARFVVTGGAVHWTLDLVIDQVGTAANEVRFTLPVTAAQNASHIGTGREDAVTGAMLQVRLAGTTTATVTRYDNASAIGAGRVLRLSGTYEPA